MNDNRRPIPATILIRWFFYDALGRLRAFNTNFSKVIAVARKYYPNAEDIWEAGPGTLAFAIFGPASSGKTTYQCIGEEGWKIVRQEETLGHLDEAVLERI